MSESGIHGSEDKDKCIANTAVAKVLIYLLDEYPEAESQGPLTLRSMWRVNAEVCAVTFRENHGEIPPAETLFKLNLLARSQTNQAV